jgi:hypothetical protein
MEEKNKIVLQTFSLFIVLALLTLVFVYGFNYLFFEANFSPAIPAIK